jgi:hypothetical protein
MNGAKPAFVLFTLVTLLRVCSLEAQELKKGTYWLVYDVHNPGHLQVCEHQTVDGTCKPWVPKDPAQTNQFFRSGSVIRLAVLNGKFRSTFKVVVNGIVIADAVPQVRGATLAPAANPPAGTAQPPAAPPLLPQLKSNAQEELRVLKDQYKKAGDAVNQIAPQLQSYVKSYLGPEPSSPEGACPPANVNAPTSTIGEILCFAEHLEGDARMRVPAGGQGFTEEDVFNNLTDRADRLIQSVTILNTVLPAPPDISNAKAEWDKFAGLAARFEQQFPSAKDEAATSEAQDYLSNGGKFLSLEHKEQEIEDAYKRIPDEIAQINTAMSRAFAYINVLYSISASPRPFDWPIGQYNSSYAAQFSIYEVANPVAYVATPAKAPPAPGQDRSPQPVNPPQAPIQNPFPQNHSSHSSSVPEERTATFTTVSLNTFSGGGAGQAPADKKQSAADKKQSSQGAQDANNGKFLYSGNFDVHKIYRANLVAGFFVSSLKNRPYGLTNNGQASSSANITYVTVMGQPYRPQIHAFVGINVYLWERDVFPGQLSRQRFLWLKKDHKWVNGYWNPGIMVGYGVDAQNNYLVGLNWETKWGINFGPGLHVGQEAFLQPGIIPGVTQLPSSATSVPTFNKTACGVYGSLGFDLGVMKSAFGQLFGGGSSVSK